MFVVSAAFSIFRTINQYNAQMAEEIKVINQLESVSHRQLAEALWRVDPTAIKTIITALGDREDVARVWIDSNDFEAPEVDIGTKPNWITLEFPLKYKESLLASENFVGDLHIALTKGPIYRTILTGLMWSTAQSLLETILAALLIIWIFESQITRHVVRIQKETHDYIASMSEHLGNPKSELNDHSQKNKSPNEIGQLYLDILNLKSFFEESLQKQRESEKQNLESALALEKEKQKVRLNQAMESIGQITAQVAHDFANIMTIVDGKANMLDRHLNDPKLLKWTQDIRQANQRAKNLIKKILSMTRSERAQFTKLNPAEAILEFQDLLQTAVGPNIALKIEREGQPAHILVEPSAFENVILNLCVNARDAMAKGGEIVIIIAGCLRQGRRYVSIQVKDNGVGIPLEVQKRIFEPFYTTKELGKGTGLGLSQVKDFIKGIGGEVEFISGSSGTCFYLFVPELAESHSSVA